MLITMFYRLVSVVCAVALFAGAILAQERRHAIEYQTVEPLLLNVDRSGLLQMAGFERP